MLCDMVRGAEGGDSMLLLLRGVDNGIARLAEIIDDMIDVSMIDNNMLSLNFQPTWIDRLLKMLVKDLQENLEDTAVYPNPYKPGSGTKFDDTSRGEGIMFDNLTSKANIRIYNIAGELVAEIDEEDGDGKILWDTKNDTGQYVASGIYIYLITNPNDSSQKAKGKFGIIR